MILRRFLHLATLWAFAAQELLSVLSQHLTFFIAKELTSNEIIFLSFTIMILVPLLTMGLLTMAKLVHPKLESILYFVSISFLVSLITLPILKKLGSDFSSLGLVLAAFVIGLGFSFFYFSKSGIRNYLTYLSPVIVIFPLYFLLASPVKQILFDQHQVLAPSSTQKNLPPVIMIILDELPASSLMDQNLRVDKKHYPHFAKLAATSTWYTNLTSVSDRTHYAVPAILSGQYPPRHQAAGIYQNYPQNLFTFLKDMGYDMHVKERFTKLCPPTLCEQEKKQTQNLKKLTQLIDDLFIVYQHVLYPNEWQKNLPSIHRNWGSFKDQLNQGKKEHFYQFLKGITDQEQPILHFLHLVLPHAPYNRLPSGKLYDPGDVPLSVPKTDGQVPGKVHEWINGYTALQAYQRHLLQLGFVDKLIGDLSHHLKKKKLFDQSLIVITADHGISFRADANARVLNPHETLVNIPDILAVPLLIKKPYQKKAVVSDLAMETVDILPLIASSIGQDVSWPIDGKLPGQLQQTPRLERIVIDASFFKKSAFDSRFFLHKKDTIKRKLKYFSANHNPDFYRFGRYRDQLLDQSVDRFPSAHDHGLTVDIDDRHAYNHIDLNSDFIPARLKGTLFTDKNTASTLAIAVNSKIAATTISYPTKAKQHRFSAMIGEKYFKPGRNQIEVFVVTQKAGRFRLQKPIHPFLTNYTLADGKIITNKGKEFKIRRNIFDGKVWHLPRRSTQNLQKLIYTGWAVDTQTQSHATQIVVFVGGKFFDAYENPTLFNPTALRDHGKALQNTGFYFEYPFDRYDQLLTQQPRFFALSQKGFAQELRMGFYRNIKQMRQSSYGKVIEKLRKLEKDL